MGWGSPPPFKKRSKCLCHWKAVWRAILEPNQPSLGRKPHTPLCALVCFVLVIRCFLGKLFDRDPSLAWLIQGKRGLGCTGVGESKVFSRQDQRVQGGTGVMLARGLQAISVAPYPSCFTPHPPATHAHTRGSWAALRGSRQTFLNLAKAGSLPPREVPALGRGHRPSLSGLPRSVGRGAGLCQA